MHQGRLRGEGNMATYKVIGKRVPRKDAVPIVTGSALYGVDMALPGMLYGKLLFSKVAHGKIKRIDTSRAERLPGVRAVATHSDVPDAKTGGWVNDKPVFAKNKVHYRGDIVAAVAADKLEIAEKAVSLIDVEYEELRAVFDCEEAIGSDAPVIHEEVVAPELSSLKKNVCAYGRIRKGNVQEAFKKADFVVEDYFETNMVHQGYLEPHAALAKVDSEGNITVWSSTQTPFGLRSSLSEVLQIPHHKIRVIGTHTGGGFGGKLTLSVEPACVILSKKTGRPVKICLTREEELTATTPRVTVKFWLKSGLTKQGRIIAKTVRSLVDTGAYTGSGPGVANMSAFLGLGPYRIDNVDAEAFTIYTNKMSCGAYRAPGSPQASFANESHIDHCAEKVGLDPLDFRLKNAWVDGDYSHTGQKLQGIGLKDCLEQVSKAVDWRNVKLEPNQGKGLAVGVWVSGGSLEGGAWVKMNENGSVSVVTGACDSGSGATWQGIPMIAAEELGVSVDDVSLYIADTASTPFDAAADGSRTTYCTGNAVRDAAIQVREKIFKAAARHLESTPDELEMKDGMVQVKGQPGRAVPLSVLADESHSEGGQFLGGASYVFSAPAYDKNTVSGDASGGYIGLTFVANAAIVEVDRETGLVKPLRYVAAQDVGFAINPLGVEGQIEGGTVQGLGQALMEQVVYDERGVTLNPNLLDYKMPTTLDVPRIESHYVEGHYADGPYRSKGVGEPSVAPPPAAIANAVYNATGKRVRKLPLNSENVLATLTSEKKA